MKIVVFLLIGWALLANSPLAQNIKKRQDRPVLDTAVLDRWPILSSPKISSHGKYMMYSVKQAGVEDFIIKAADGNWQKSYPGDALRFFFSGDERQAIFEQDRKLHIVTLGEDEPDQIIETGQFFKSHSGSNDWCSYQGNNNSGRLILISLLDGKKFILDSISIFAIDDQGRDVVLADTIRGNILPITRLQIMNLKTLIKKEIWKGKEGDEVQALGFNGSGKQLYFKVAQKEANSISHSIWVYQMGTEKSVLKFQEGGVRVDSALKIAGRPEFTKDGKWLSFTLEKQQSSNVKIPLTNTVDLDVWSYHDKLLQSQQLGRKINNAYQIQVVISTNGNILRQLKHQENWVDVQDIDNDQVLTYQIETNGAPDPWSRFHFLRTFDVFSLIDGSRKNLGRLKASNLSYSPDGKWVVFYDYGKDSYFSYELKTGKLINLTGGLPSEFSSDYPTDILRRPVSPIAGWVKETGEMLVYDNYDLWRIDPSGSRKPISVTFGYGMSHHEKLRVLGEEEGTRKTAYSIRDTVLLTGFNITNKYNGFFKKILGNNGPPELLYEGPCTFYKTASQQPHGSFDNGMCPVKASNANVWIVKRQSAKEAPNYFLTTDFRRFKPITDNKPQKNYNWLTTELINYKQLDGTPSQGILYKPENFDPTKKYPVIFNYYEQLSQRLYEFPYPEWTTNNINIPWFVSHGYLVFTPDIHYQFANKSGIVAGQYAYDSIIGATKYLSKLSYVDSKKMGLQGHSFGGAETNYLVTHSHIFAVAAEMAGPSDAVSNYLTLLPTNNGEESQEEMGIAEYGQVRFGATLWQKPNFYLRSSAVLKADHVTTPLLITHNKMDDAVPWRQGVELYMALRRLNKPSWMLQYDGERHNLTPNSKAAKDYTIRLTQFFDHYLKGYPPPVWMTRGIPAKLKGIETGYELDPNGECGPDCPICKKKDYKNFDPKLAVIQEFVKDPPTVEIN